jgi:hypothetical protein
MIDEVWKHKIEADMKKCNEIRVRLEETDKHQGEKIEKNVELIEHMYDYKNNIYRKITFIEANKVDRKEFDAISKCVNTMKTEKKFLPWVVMIFSVIGTIVSVVYMLLKVAAMANAGG